jgi:glycosyltransferase involved in cell wall biosynthesis
MVSILLLTIDRYELTKQCVGNALNNAGTDYELLVVDNGSKDERVIKYIESLKPVYFRKNKKNLGIGCMYNHLSEKAKGEYLCIIDNDIELPNNWLKNAVNEYKETDGLLGFKCVEGPNNSYVYGTKFISKKKFNEVGKFDEKFGLYGIEDSDLNRKLIDKGLTNRYIGSSVHLGVGENDTGEYRKMKDEALRKAWIVEPKIPRRIHRIWIGDLPKPNLIETWKEKHIDYDFYEWDNETIKTFPFRLKKHIDKFIEKGMYHGAADLIRYEVLYKYGGFVAPADSECLNSIDELLNCDSFCCYENEQIRPKLLSPHIGACPNNRLLGLIIDELESRETLLNEDPWVVTGNFLLTNMRVKHNYQDMKIFPSHYFIPEHYTGIKYQGDGKVYARHFFGTTNNINNELSR